MKNSLDPNSSQKYQPTQAKMMPLYVSTGFSIYLERRWNTVKVMFPGFLCTFSKKIKPHLLRRVLLYAWFNLGVIPPPEALWWLSYSGMYHWEHRGVQEFDVELVVNMSEVWDLEYSFTNAGFYSAHTLLLHIYMIYMYIFAFIQLLSLLLLFVLFLLFLFGPIDFLIDLGVVSFLSMFCFVNSATLLLWFTLLPYKAKVQ